VRRCCVRVIERALVGMDPASQCHQPLPQRSPSASDAVDARQTGRDGSHEVSRERLPLGPAQIAPITCGGVLSGHQAPSLETQRAAALCASVHSAQSPSSSRPMDLGRADEDFASEKPSLHRGRDARGLEVAISTAAARRGTRRARRLPEAAAMNGQSFIRRPQLMVYGKCYALTIQAVIRSAFELFTDPQAVIVGNHQGPFIKEKVQINPKAEAILCVIASFVDIWLNMCSL
jgi:hypothetical protein